MIVRLVIALVLLVTVVTVVGFTALAAWDISVPEQQVEKVLENGKILTKAP
jgi:hypothetical protein